MIRTKNLIHPGEILMEEFLKRIQPCNIVHNGRVFYCFCGMQMGMASTLTSSVSTFSSNAIGSSF